MQTVRSIVLQHGTIHSIKRGTEVMRSYGNSAALHMVISGTVACEMTMPHATVPLPIRYYFKQGIFGATEWLAKNVKYNHPELHYTAEEACHLVVMPYNRLRPLLDGSLRDTRRAVETGLTKIALEQYQYTLSRISMLSEDELLPKVRRTLHHLAAQNAHRHDNAETHVFLPKRRRLADFVGCSRGAFTRCLREMKDAGELQTEGKEIILTKHTVH